MVKKVCFILRVMTTNAPYHETVVNIPRPHFGKFAKLAANDGVDVPRWIKRKIIQAATDGVLTGCAPVARVLLSTKDAAAAFAVSPATIRAWMHAGCPVVFIGSARTGRGSRPRFEAAALRAWLGDRQTITTAAQ